MSECYDDDMSLVIAANLVCILFARLSLLALILFLSFLFFNSLDCLINYFFRELIIYSDVNERKIIHDHVEAKAKAGLIHAGVQTFYLPNAKAGLIHARVLTFYLPSISTMLYLLSHRTFKTLNPVRLKKEYLNILYGFFSFCL